MKMGPGLIPVRLAHSLVLQQTSRSFAITSVYWLPNHGPPAAGLYLGLIQKSNPVQPGGLPVGYTSGKTQLLATIGL